MTGLARKGRNSVTIFVGKSSGTEDVFFEDLRIEKTSCSAGMQGTSDTKSALGGTRLRRVGLTGVNSLLILAKY